MGRSKCCRKVKHQPCPRRGGIFSSILAFFDRSKRCARCTCRTNCKSERQSQCCQSSPCCSRLQYAPSYPDCRDFSQYQSQGCPPPSPCCHQPILTCLSPR